MGRASLLDEVPGGNQVDGLPPVASKTGAGAIWRAIQSEHCPDLFAFAGFVLCTCRFVLHETPAKLKIHV